MTPERAAWTPRFLRSFHTLARNFPPRWPETVRRENSPPDCFPASLPRNAAGAVAVARDVEDDLAGVGRHRLPAAGVAAIGRPGLALGRVFRALLAKMLFHPGRQRVPPAASSIRTECLACRKGCRLTGLPSACPAGLWRGSYVDLLSEEFPRQSTKFRIVPVNRVQSMCRPPLMSTISPVMNPAWVPER